jgi:hypothetical protein
VNKFVPQPRDRKCVIAVLWFLIRRRLLQIPMHAGFKSSPVRKGSGPAFRYDAIPRNADTWCLVAKGENAASAVIHGGAIKVSLLL